MAFSLCASSVYLLNDMLDLEADRQHHSKSQRPFAAGRLSLLFGLGATPVLLVLALGLCALLPLKFMGVLVAYYVATLAYSFGLKKVVMVDVLALAGLYTVRIVAGAAATAIPLSFWLLMFAVFIFLSLAIVKRYAELFVMRQQGKLKASGRGYQVEDISLLQSLGTASGYLSILVLALYLNTPDIPSCCTGSAASGWKPTAARCTMTRWSMRSKTAPAWSPGWRRLCCCTSQPETHHGSTGLHLMGPGHTGPARGPGAEQPSPAFATARRRRQRLALWQWSLLRRQQPQPGRCLAARRPAGPLHFI